MSSRIRGGPPELWVNRPGNKLRRQHIAIALTANQGWVDAVIVEGVPGEGVDRAEPWQPKERKGRRWRITAFDDETGHFTIEALPHP